MLACYYELIARCLGFSVRFIAAFAHSLTFTTLIIYEGTAECCACGALFDRSGRGELIRPFLVLWS